MQTSKREQNRAKPSTRTQVLRLLRSIQNDLTRLNQRLDEVEQRRRLNQLILALETVFRKIGFHDGKAAPATLHEELPMFVGVVCEIPPLTSAEHSVPASSVRCFCSLVANVAKALPTKYHEDFRGNSNRLLRCLQAHFDAFEWGPIPHANAEGDVTWIVHVIPDKEAPPIGDLPAAGEGRQGRNGDDALARDGIARNRTLGSELELASAMAGYDGAAIQFDGFDVRDLQGPYFRCLVLMTLYVHWQRDDLSFAFKRIRKTLADLTRLSAVTSTKDQLCGEQKWERQRK